MKCPNDGTKLKKLGISLVCPRCPCKIIQSDKKRYPELNRTVLVPETISWGSFTLSGCSESGGVLSLDGSEISGTITSPQLANLTRNESMGMWHDITLILFRRLTGQNNGGKIKISSSNDGGTTWKRVKDDGQEWRLNHGHEGDFGGRGQDKYNDLRIRFTLSRSSTGDTSPTITNFTIEHNYVPEIRKTKSRENVNEIILGG